MKRILSNATLPPPKRLHTLAGAAAPLFQLTFENALSEELILLIFSHLSWVDLCNAQRVSQNWHRIAKDQSLWKSLFITTFGRSRLRGAKGFTGRTDGRDMRPMPGRAQPSTEAKDWRSMFRISFRWKTGRCTTEHIEGILKPHKRPTPKPPHVLLAGSTTIIASSEDSSNPEIHCLQSSGSPKQILRCGSPRHPHSCHITAIALDQSPPTITGTLRLAVFLSTGEFLVFSVHPSNPSSTIRLFSYIPARQVAIVRQSVYHHPLLVSLSEAFVIALYDLSSESVRHTQSLSSYSTFPPSSMILSTQTPGSRSMVYKLVLTYSVPIFPLHYSLGVTELLISCSASHVSNSTSSSTPFSFESPSEMSVISTRTTRALDVPQGWIDQEKLQAMKDQWGRKVLHIQDTRSDGKWVVLAPGEGRTSAPSVTDAESLSPYTLSGNSGGSLQLYRLFLPPVTSVASPPPKLAFTRYLYHTVGTVTSMSIADGRCVTLGKTMVCIWDLESGTSAEVALPESMCNGEPEQGTVAFDDRRIITARGGTVLVHRFD
ncbi:hypothetical protein MIND_00070100 [Mycena indigotica]|uniref:F-box domain-containing protein n=1 Tax=Mycena indigotica TaxID=2126181 RepID=A0A8H6TD82_9AGAR|nr:uncharacterized protein MIND_00070100 [Mycena indigotica]KAF7315548.1 hypothetical protein MIND_00070100 [Mycena indigotica]